MTARAAINAVRAVIVKLARMTASVLQAIAAGSPDAVAVCFEKYLGPIRAIARRYIGSLDDVDDAVQEVFLHLWRMSGRFDPARGSEVAFVLTIARRRLLDVARRRGRGLGREVCSEDFDFEAETVPDAAEVREEAQRIETAMAAIDPVERRVILLSVEQGQSHQQVAERTGLPLGTVKSHARRGLAKIRELLRDSAGDAGRT